MRLFIGWKPRQYKAARYVPKRALARAFRASSQRVAALPNVPTFKEKGIDFLWEQMRGVCGPADMGAEAVKWWQDTLRKVTETPKWQTQYIKRNLLTPVQWVGEEANEYLDSLRGKYTDALTALGAIKK